MEQKCSKCQLLPPSVDNGLCASCNKSEYALASVSPSSKSSLPTGHTSQERKSSNDKVRDRSPIMRCPSGCQATGLEFTSYNKSYQSSNASSSEENAWQFLKYLHDSSNGSKVRDFKLSLSQCSLFKNPYSISVLLKERGN